MYCSQGGLSLLGFVPKYMHRTNKKNGESCPALPSSSWAAYTRVRLPASSWSTWGWLRWRSLPTSLWGWLHWRSLPTSSWGWVRWRSLPTSSWGFLRWRSLSLPYSSSLGPPPRHGALRVIIRLSPSHPWALCVSVQPCGTPNACGRLPTSSWDLRRPCSAARVVARLCVSAWGYFHHGGAH
jgi:hypothetical protein